jgi:energy-coupling factor transporter ATP-binding protein EcfA2
MPHLSSRLKPQKNPFEFGRELDQNELVDRKKELDQIVRSIENTAKLFLIGPRRYGKTSLLKAAETIGSAGGAVVLRYDAERYESMDLLAEALLSAGTRRLATTVERAGALLTRVAGKLKPEINYDVGDQSFSVRLLAPARSELKSRPLPMLVDVLDVIERLATETEHDVIVIIDEFQHVVAQGGAAAERQLRAAVQRHRKVGYVFAGSATHLLSDMTGDTGRAFYKLGARLFLGPIPRDEFAVFLRSGFEAAGFEVEDLALARILELAADVPYTVQRLAHECWEMLRVAAAVSERTADIAVLTVEGVSSGLTHVLEQEDAAYTQLWNSLRLQQKRTLKAVILEDGVSLLSATVSQRYNVPTASMQKALGALDDRGIIREEGAGGSISYRLEDPLLGHWLRWSQQLASG